MTETESNLSRTNSSMHLPMMDGTAPPMPTRSRMGSRGPNAGRVNQLAMRKAKFSAFASSPSLGVDADIINEVANVLPDTSELKFVRYTLQKTYLVVLSTKYLCTVKCDENGVLMMGGKLHFSVPVTEVDAIFDSTIDENAIFLHTKTPKQMSLKDYEQRVLIFENRTEREHFVAHLYVVASTPTGVTGQSGPIFVESPINLHSWEAPLKTVDDAKKNYDGTLKEAKRLGQNVAMGTSGAGNPGGDADDALNSNENDNLQIASRDALTAKIRSFGDTKIYFSSEVQTADNKHDILILTNTSVYIGKVRNFTIRHRIVLDALEAIFIDQSQPDLLLLQIDFSLVTTLKGDVTLRFPSNRLRDQFVKIISKVYEETVVDKLNVEVSENIFWIKRGMVESQLLRMVQVFKDKKQDSAEEMTEGQKESARWLSHLFKKSPEILIACLSQSQLSGEAVSFVVHAFATLGEQFGMTEKLLRHCLEWEIFGTCGYASDFALPRSQHHNHFGYFQNKTFATFFLEEYLAENFQQYLQVVLSQVVEEFSDDPSGSDDVIDFEELQRWTGMFLTQIFEFGGSSEMIPDELKVVVSLITELCRGNTSCSQLQKSPTENPTLSSLGTDPFPIIGSLLFEMFFFPGLQNPRAHGLLWKDLSETKQQNLTRVASLLQSIGSFQTPSGEMALLEQFASAKFGPMREFLKNLMYSDVLMEPSWKNDALDSSDEETDDMMRLRHSCNAAQDNDHFNSTFRQVKAQAQLSQLNLKLFFAIHKQLSCYCNRLMYCAWISGKRQSKLKCSKKESVSKALMQKVRSLPTAPGEEEVTSSGRKEMGQAKKQQSAVFENLSDGENSDEEELAPPSDEEDRDSRKGSASPLKTNSKSGFQPSAYSVDQVQKLKQEIELLRHEQEQLRQHAAKSNEFVAQSAAQMLFLQEQTHHFRLELLQERGLVPTGRDDSEDEEIYDLIRETDKNIEKRAKRTFFHRYHDDTTMSKTNSNLAANFSFGSEASFSMKSNESFRLGSDQTPSEDPNVKSDEGASDEDFEEDAGSLAGSFSGAQQRSVEFSTASHYNSNLRKKIRKNTDAKDRPTGGGTVTIGSGTVDQQFIARKGRPFGCPMDSYILPTASSTFYNIPSSPKIKASAGLSGSGSKAPVVGSPTTLNIILPSALKK